MPDYFNFLGLPSVVQELITEEIVHNSIPEDRIQLALTSKYCNELVQRARPKKIIDQFTIWRFSSFTFIAYSRKYSKTKEQLMEILPDCQVERLQLGDESVFSSEEYSGILDVLSEAARFATKMDILCLGFHHLDKMIGFYVKLKHLKSVTLREPDLILPYYPPRVKLKFGPFPPGNFLKDLAKKSQNCALSFLAFEGRISLQKYQQFLQTAKFSTDAEICIQCHRMHIPVYLTYLCQNIFTFEMFPNDSVPVVISQKFVEKNKRILKLKRTGCFPEIAFNVVSASNSEKKYSSGVFKKRKNEMLINLENVDRDEILEVKFAGEIISYRKGNRVTKYSVHPIYSAKMLESAFPSANFTTPEERVQKINNVLGKNIQLIQADNFAQIVRAALKVFSQ